MTAPAPRGAGERQATEVTGREWAPAAGGLPRSLLIGATFAMAWSPCIGPILGVVLTLAAASGTAAQGALLLACYSLGLGVWFVAMGACFGWLSPRLRRVRAYLPALMIASGALFIVLGALMFLGEFTRLSRSFQDLGFLFSSTSNVEQGLTDSVHRWLGPAVAFLGGVVSFLSPCVLPLVPAYLVNIASEAALSASDASGAGEPPSAHAAASRHRVIAHAIAFVVGFTLVFSAVGASAGLVGDALSSHLEVLTRAGGVVMMLLGMHMSGLVHLPLLDRTYEVRLPRGT